MICVILQAAVMVHHCIAPHCNSHSGTPSCIGVSFYALPLNRPALLKKWLVKIKRQNTPVNTNSQVCSRHFVGGKKNGDDVSTIFAWTKSSRPPPQSRPEPCLKCKKRVRSVANKENESAIGTPKNVTTTKATTNASVACDSQKFEHQETLESASNTAQNVTAEPADVQNFQHQETLASASNTS